MVGILSCDRNFEFALNSFRINRLKRKLVYYSLPVATINTLPHTWWLKQTRNFRFGLNSFRINRLNGKSVCYLLPVATLTHYHVPDGLKQQEFILNLESRSLKSRAHSPQGLLGRILSLLLPAPVAPGFSRFVAATLQSPTWSHWHLLSL